LKYDAFEKKKIFKNHTMLGWCEREILGQKKNVEVMGVSDFHLYI